MKNRRAGVWLALALIAVVALGVFSRFDRQAGAQTQAAYTPPRTPDGKADLQGIWQVLNTADVNVLDHGASTDGPGGLSVVGGNVLPYQPSALAKKKENFDKRMTADPVRRCFLPGVPRATYVPFPFQILQTPDYVAIAYEFGHARRIIYMNKAEHQEDIDAWMGDSRGRWEGDTLVVDVTNFNDQTWFDRMGNHHSDALHVVERYTRTGPDHMLYEATIEDPKVFTRPWKMRMTLYRRTEANAQLLDYQCYAFDHDKKGLTVPLARMDPAGK